MPLETTIPGWYHHLYHYPPGTSALSLSMKGTYLFRLTTNTRECLSPPEVLMQEVPILWKSTNRTKEFPHSPSKSWISQVMREIRSILPLFTKEISLILGLLMRLKLLQHHSPTTIFPLPILPVFRSLPGRATTIRLLFTTKASRMTPLALPLLAMVHGPMRSTRPMAPLR